MRVDSQGRRHRSVEVVSGSRLLTVVYLGRRPHLMVEGVEDFVPGCVVTVQVRGEHRRLGVGDRIPAAWRIVHGEAPRPSWRAPQWDLPAARRAMIPRVHASGRR
jgi:hypothetical protein